MMSPHTDPALTRHLLQHDAFGARGASWTFLAANIAFIVYGSLFPFDFLRTPFPLEHFLTEWHIFENRSDALDNFLLFIPLGIALRISFSKARSRLIAYCLTVLLLAIGLQLLQLYLPSRTASLADAFWNSTGMLCGALIATRVRSLLLVRLALSPARHDYFSMLLLALWLLYESFPFVPTLDIGLLRDHIKTVVLAPPFESMRLIQHALASALAGSAMLRVNWLKVPRMNLLLFGGLAVFLEVFVAYGSLRRETLLGIGLGLSAGYWIETRYCKRSLKISFVLAFCAFLITVLTPYRGQALHAGFTFTPFSHLLWQGISKDIVPAAFEALMIGTLLWSGLANQRLTGRLPYVWVSTILLLVAAAEYLRVSFLGVHGDTTTLTMALILSPFALALRAQAAVPARLRAAPVQVRMSVPGTTSQPIPEKKMNLLWLAGSAVLLTMGLWLLLQLPGIPYNLKKLFGAHPFAGAAVFSLVLLWLGAAPWLLAVHGWRPPLGSWRQVLWTPLWLLLIALISFILVDTAVPAIMLEKIIGAPDLYRRILEDNLWGESWRAALAPWPQRLVSSIERVVRYCALYSIFMIPLTLAALAVPRADRLVRLLSHLPVLLACWWLAKFVLLDHAITDNLTELIKPDGVFFLALLILTLAIHATYLAAQLAYQVHGPGLYLKLGGLALALLPFGWWLLSLGIEPFVINNNRVFSGIQFLLGENRETQLSDLALFVRWCLLYLSGAGVTALGMFFAMRLGPIAEENAATPI